MSQEKFQSAYKVAKNQGYNALDSMRIADKYNKQHTSTFVTGKKSFALNTSNFTGNVVDILVGYPGEDTEAQFGGLKLEDKGWSNIPTKPMTFDLNHLNFDSIRGIKNDLDEKWHNFAVKIDDWYADEEGLKAKAYVPETELGTEFLDDYKQGKYGVSVEYEGDQQGNIVKDWKITSGTFHDDPGYINTKPKGL